MKEKLNKVWNWAVKKANNVYTKVKENPGVVVVGALGAAVVITEEVRLGKRIGNLEKKNQELEKQNQDLQGQVRAAERENRRLGRENGNLNYQLGKMAASKNK